VERPDALADADAPEAVALVEGERGGVLRENTGLDVQTPAVSEAWMSAERSAEPVPDPRASSAT